jgi:hypothetical protein
MTINLLDAQPSSVFPDLPRTQQISIKDGILHPDWSLGLAALFQICQKQFSNEGYQFPRLTPIEQAAIQSIYQPYIVGVLPLPIDVPDISSAMIYDPVNFVPKMFIITFNTDPEPKVLTASWKTFTLT